MARVRVLEALRKSDRRPTLAQSSTLTGMKTLFLIRHAKSSKDDPSLRDIERPLNHRDRRTASKMGEVLAKRGVKPDLILSSPATRALATAEIMVAKLGYNSKDIVLDDQLYAVEEGNLLYVIRKLDKNLLSVMLFGHNPELTDLAHRLSPDITDMATCAVLEFAFEANSWSSVGKVKPARVRLIDPKKKSYVCIA